MDFSMGAILLASIQQRSLRSLLSLICLATLLGCSQANPSPEAKVKTPLGTTQVCHHCLNPVTPVKSENLITLGGVQYVVCGAACAQEVVSGLDSQGTIVPAQTNSPFATIHLP